MSKRPSPKRWQCLAIGLPAAGKTTFLAAAWFIAESPEVHGALRASRLTPDREHLNAIRARWLRGEQAVRTRQAGDRHVKMILEAEDKIPIEVSFPDMAGEAFRTHYVQRGWPKRYDDLLMSARGILLFIHPNRLSAPDRIDEANRINVELNAYRPPQTHDESQTQTQASKKFSLEESPTQVILVDLLQMIADRRESKPMRLAVIISAWDLIRRHDSPQIGPNEWLEKRVPLLWQYLTCRTDLFPWKGFGVSAWGDEALGSEGLAALPDQAQRITVIDGGDAHPPALSPHDVTAPIRWLVKG